MHLSAIPPSYHSRPRFSFPFTLHSGSTRSTRGPLFCQAYPKFVVAKVLHSCFISVGLLPAARNSFPATMPGSIRPSRSLAAQRPRISRTPRCHCLVGQHVLHWPVFL